MNTFTIQSIKRMKMDKTIAQIDILSIVEIENKTPIEQMTSDLEDSLIEEANELIKVFHEYFNREMN